MTPDSGSKEPQDTISKAPELPWGPSKQGRLQTFPEQAHKELFAAPFSGAAVGVNV
ncbi:hypothetical protein [Aquidulcibacter sp.]|uniref:hypothetical protein n=1 Tax=Aquidulcibacter sp. TaxID=2052990 RepID=UPI0025BDFE7D|nr:hypothetical protein [Aquidulcibacter sp.]